MQLKGFSSEWVAMCITTPTLPIPRPPPHLLPPPPYIRILLCQSVQCSSTMNPLICCALIFIHYCVLSNLEVGCSKGNICFTPHATIENVTRQIAAALIFTLQFPFTHPGFTLKLTNQQKWICQLYLTVIRASRHCCMPARSKLWLPPIYLGRRILAGF